ncbi:MAG: choice-of-anchor J domain-containing protein [Candidatus Thermoplasmatota archaeon]|nr:choice-of-anchor J domain-containing protein [Candidatus Thermoplasmatota archaeon]MCG2825230.1 choice-of-anchor J domain-containing protein [Thermoplasmatales archaeon]
MSAMNDKAVSEVIGSILTLAITIVLFSTVMLWVMSFQGPVERTFVDLTPSLDVNTGNISIIHKGGETLKNGEVFVYVTINGTTNKCNMSDGGVGDEWTVGETWSKTFDITLNDTVSVSVVTKTEVVLDVALQGKREGDNTPVICFAWCSPENVPADNTTLFRIYAVISDVDNDVTNVTVNLSKINLGVQSLSEINKLYQTNPLKVPTNTTTKKDYTFMINTTDSKNNYCTYNVSMHVTTVTKTEGPDLSVSSSDISVSTKNPMRGSSISISVIVKNFGGAPAIADIVLYDETVSVYKVTGIMVPSLGESSRVLYYTNVSPAGKHNMTVSIENITPEEEPGFLDNNKATFTISVLTKILLVDDDHHINDGSVNDTTGFMENALQVSGFDYQVYTVDETDDAADGPEYDSSSVQMKDFDVVIWMTGYHEVNGGTLTSNDQTELETFLDNGGKLWLISEYIIDDVGPSNNFVRTTLHAPSSTYLGTTAPVSPIYGNNASPVSAGMEFETIERVSNHGDYITPDSDAIRMFNDSKAGPNNCTALTYENNVTGEKIAFFSFEFSTIESLDDQAELAYKVLMWMGNLSSIQGRDVAVSSQSFTPANPSFRQTVTITATIRNNGASDEPSVGVLFYMDDVSIAGIQYVSIGAFNSTTVSVNWTAEPVGTHTLRVMADPYYEIDETNERNNELRSRIASTSLYVSFSILVVDDDNSTNNNDGGGFNTTAYITNALNNLSYSYYFYEVPSGIDGPSLDNLTKHNVVIWACGNETSNTLRNNDRNNIKSYLNQGGALWLIGQGIVNDLWGTDFLNNTLKANSSENDTGTPRNIYGFKNDPVTHGIYYATSSLFPDKADRITPANDSRPIVCNASDTGKYYGLRFENSTCKIIFFPFEFGFICGEAVEIGGEFTESILWEENFDPPDEWTKNPADNVWEIGEPTKGIGPGSSNSAPNCTATKLAGNYKNNEDDWLVSPSITLPADALSIKLSFWHWYEIEKDYDYGYVKIKPRNGTVWETLGTYTGDYKSWHKSSIDITKYAGETVNISFHFTSDGWFSYKGWYIDDMHIVTRMYQPGAALPHNGEKEREELALLTLTWIGYPEERIELRITDVDVDAPEHPVLGRAYELKARIWNAGYKGADVVVRFYEGDTIIDTKTVHVEGRSSPDSLPYTDMVTIWRPYYARTDGKVSVIIDKDNNIPEIGYPEKLLENNLGEKTRSISFFYDDFENGSGNWESSAMVMQINSEGYRGMNGANTDIPTAWASTYIYGNTSYTSDAHSKPKCTQLIEYEKVLTAAVADPSWVYTPSINVSNAQKAELTFWHKFKLTSPVNGAMLQVAYKNTAGGSVETGTPYWVYITGAYMNPTASYNSNQAGWDVPEGYDDEGTYMKFCWNGYGTDGLYDWEFVKVDLTSYIQKAEQYSNGNLRVRFYLLVYEQYYGLYPYGTNDTGAADPYNYGGMWLIDDVEAHVYRGGKDMWHYLGPEDTYPDSHSGDRAFWCGDNSTGYFTGSMDCSLTSTPIDLTTAKDAKLEFWTKFNIKMKGGWPGDWCQIAVSDDMGSTWHNIQFGLTFGWNVSGTRSDAQDAPSDDGKSYTGITPDGGPGWVSSNTLMKISADLSGASGSTILIRITMITNNDADLAENASLGWGGIYIDDIRIIGNSSSGGGKSSFSEIQSSRHISNNESTYDNIEKEHSGKGEDVISQFTILSSFNLAEIKDQKFLSVIILKSKKD